MAAPPDGITLERHRDLDGRSRHPLYRRALLLLIAALPVLALIGVFGQHSSTTTVGTGAASLSVTAPTRLRSGLIFQTRAEVIAHREIVQPELVFARGWWEAISVNSIAPEPSESSTVNGAVALTYGKLKAGQRLVVWIYQQVNPTTSGRRSADVELQDGSTPLAHINRKLTIFP
jgi:hypothetical protein